MRIDSESAAPTADSLDLVDRVAAELKAASSRRNLSSWVHRYVRNHRKRLAFDLDAVKLFVPLHAKILEIGSIPPILTGALKTTGYAVTGIDIGPERFVTSIESMGLSVLKCDVERESFPVPSDSFDCVLLNEVFEHLRINPIFTLSEVFRVCKPGALLLLSTPNLRSAQGIVNFLYHQRSYSCSGDIYEEYEKVATLGHMGHVREYTFKEVADFLARLGFTVETVTFRGQYKKTLFRFLARMFPTLRPFMSVRARKPDSNIRPA
jgi:2-polyprenyl-3-methyl-5-hydroxy-6-metoxy-1,4-benzoquinol methylase